MSNPQPQQLSSADSTTPPVPVAVIAIISTALLLALLVLALIVWRTHQRRRATRTDAEAPSEKKPSTALHLSELCQLPRAYTRFSSLSLHWSPRASHAPAPAISDADANLPIYATHRAPAAPAPVHPASRHRYSSRAARRERDVTVQSFHHVDSGGLERERVMGKLNGLMGKMRVEFKDEL